MTQEEATRMMYRISALMTGDAVPFVYSGSDDRYGVYVPQAGGSRILWTEAECLREIVRLREEKEK